MYYYNIFYTKLGYASLVSNGSAIVRFFLPVHKNYEMVKLVKKTYPNSINTNTPLLKNCSQMIKDYFNKIPVSFTNIPVEFMDLSDFVIRVLNIICLIPYGEVRTYKWISKKLKTEDANRAVGNALRENPIPVIVPCHRVIRSDGELGGFSYGLKWKIKLLSIEKVLK